MRKIVGLITAIFLLLVAVAPRVDAAEATLLLGQNHNYNVHFRSNGEAIITARVVFHNKGTAEQKNFELEIPGNVYEVYSLQQVLPKTCKRYNYDKTTYNTSTCAEYAEPDYTQDYYGYSRTEITEYKKLTPKQSGNKFTFDLVSPVAEDKSGALIIAYATKSYATTRWGNTSFDFQSFKANERIQKLKVAVTFDDDVYYEGKQSKTQYAPESSAGISALADSAATSNSSLKNYVGRIGTEGLLTKEASNLAPGDIFHVRGSYATSWWALHRSTIIWVIAGLIALIVGFFMFSRWRAKKPKKPNSSEGGDNLQNSGQGTSGEPKQSAPMRTTQPMKVLGLTVTPLFGSFLYALLSVVGSSAGCFVVALALAAALNDVDSYSRTAPQQVAMIFTVTAAAITVLLGTLTLPTLLARRRGLRYFFMTLAFEVVWLLIAVFILGLFSKDTDSSNRYPGYSEPFLAQ